jgi:phosphohistidine phosphatase
MAAEPRRLYLIRHAIAAARGPRWPDDRRRPLTARGIERMQAIVKGLARLEAPPDVILTSPLTRAIETARLVSDGLEGHPVVRELAPLAPGHGAARTASALAAAVHEARRIAAVGHEPDLGRLAAWLIGADQPLPFKKGGIGRIDLARWPPDGRGQLVWLATPRLLRR